MLHAGALATYACDGVQNVRDFRARLLDMIRPGDVTSYDGVITSFIPTDDGLTADVELKYNRQIPR